MYDTSTEKMVIMLCCFAMVIMDVPWGIALGFGVLFYPYEKKGE